jgi:membrane-associated phospholipid phosphatase
MVLASVLLAGAGAVILVLSILAARHDRIPRREITIFRWINRLPNWLYPILWLPMQLGNLVVGCLAGIVVAIVVGDLGIAIGVVVATGMKLIVERVVRHEVAGYLAIRQRPGTSQQAPILRGDVPETGPSFPSGHVILIAAIACIVAIAFPPGLVWIPWVLAVLVAVGRVYVGAHNPLDVTSGFGAGMLIGGGLLMVAGWL